MPALPEGTPVPDDGALPGWVRPSPSAPDGAGRRFGVYVHVPFCSVRCGYCDFNTYTAHHRGEPSSTPPPEAVRSTVSTGRTKGWR